MSALSSRKSPGVLRHDAGKPSYRPVSSSPSTRRRPGSRDHGGGPRLDPAFRGQDSRVRRLPPESPPLQVCAETTSSPTAITGIVREVGSQGGCGEPQPAHHAVISREGTPLTGSPRAASGISFRPASSADVPAMIACREGEPADPRVSAYFDGQHHPHQTLPPRVGCVAVVEGSVVGYVAAHLTTRHGLQGGVQSLFVAQNYRRRGIARELIRRVAAWFDTDVAMKVSSPWMRIVPPPLCSTAPSCGSDPRFCVGMGGHLRRAAMNHLRAARLRPPRFSCVPRSRGLECGGCACQNPV